MTDNNIGTTEATEASTPTGDNSQATERFYTQKEVDDMMARTKSAVTKKVASKYEDLGDPEQIRDILTQHAKREQENAVRRGDFDKVIQELASKKDAEIQKRDRMIEQFKLETPIIDAASKHRAVNPGQVKSLIRNNLRLNPEGEVEVLDDEGKVRYDDSGRLLSVDSFVQTWLQNNPHFVSATPSTSNSRSNVSGSMNNAKLDLAGLDMKNPEHKKQYAEYRKAAGIA
jgi:hypothetical protein